MSFVVFLFVNCDGIVGTCWRHKKFRFFSHVPEFFDAMDTNARMQAVIAEWRVVKDSEDSERESFWQCKSD